MPVPNFFDGRDLIVKSLREELVGPCPRGAMIDCSGDITFPDRESAYGPWRQADTGEEIHQRDRPIKRYGIGVLYPPMTAGETDPPEKAEQGPAAAEEVPAGGGEDTRA